MERLQNYEENEQQLMNNWITTSTATVTDQLVSVSPLPGRKQRKY